MGHYSDFEISFECNEDDELKLREWLDTFDEENLPDEMYDCYQALTLGLENETLGDRKWYECKKDMLKVSKQFPNVLFTVHVNSEFGEYRYYFKHSKYQRVEPEFPEFDESRLE